MSGSAPTVHDSRESPLDPTEPDTSRQPDTDTATDNPAGGGEANMASTPTPAADANASSTPTPAPAPAPDADRIQIIVKDQTGNQVGFALKPNTRMSKVMNAYADRQGRDVRSLRFWVDGVRVLEDSTPAALEMEQDDIVEVTTEQLGGGFIYDDLDDGGIDDGHDDGDGEDPYMAVVAAGRASAKAIGKRFYSESRLGKLTVTNEITCLKKSVKMTTTTKEVRYAPLPTKSSSSRVESIVKRIRASNNYRVSKSYTKPKGISIKFGGGNKALPPITYTMRSSSKLGLFMRAYTKGVDFDMGPHVGLRFSFDGQRVLDADTPESLGMEQEDTIEVYTEQLGGGPAKPGVKKEKVNGVKKEDSVEINGVKSEDEAMNEEDEEVEHVLVMATKVGGKDIAEVDFIVNRSVRMKTLKKAWSQRAGIKLSDVVFRWNDEKEGPGLPFEEHDWVATSLDHWGDALYVNAVADEPIDLTKAIDLDSDADDDESVTLEPVSQPKPDLIFITVHFGNKHMHVRMNTTTPFQKILDEYAESREEDPRDYHLTHEGNVIFNNDTPDMIGLESGDQLVIKDDGELLFLDLAKL